MTNKEFITTLSERTDIPSAQCTKMVEELRETFVNLLEDGNEIVVAGLGNFEVKQKKERIMINPLTSKKMLVPPKLTLSFKMSSTYKQKINSANDLAI